MIFTTAVAIAVYILVQSVRELIQMYQQRWNYWMDPGNFISWMLYIAAIIMILPVFLDSYSDLQFSCAAITVFLSWFNLLLYLQRSVGSNSATKRLRLALT